MDEVFRVESGSVPWCLEFFYGDWDAWSDVKIVIKRLGVIANKAICAPCREWYCIRAT